ncbi:conserved hypothetical protein [Vibrio owensii]|jgi:hypothetical protein|nr:conserved hypothetical protein [Vibrio owensii]
MKQRNLNMIHVLKDVNLIRDFIDEANNVAYEQETIIRED